MRTRFTLVAVLFIVVVAACSGGASPSPGDTTPPAEEAPAAQVTTTEAAPETTTTEAAPETTTTMVEVVEGPVMFSELSGDTQAFTAAICTATTGFDGFIALTETFGGFHNVINGVILGATGVPQLKDAWSEVEGQNPQEYLDASIPICVAIGWIPG